MSMTPLPENFVHGHDVRGLCVAFTMSELDLPKHAIGYLLIRSAQYQFLSHNQYLRSLGPSFRTV